MDIGKFIKHDPQRFVSGSLANQIRVLLQRMRMKSFEPWKIMLSSGLRFALETECESRGLDYKKTDKGHFYMGLLIKVDSTVKEPIILIKPVVAPKPEKALSTWERKGSYARN